MKAPGPTSNDFRCAVLFLALGSLAVPFAVAIAGEQPEARAPAEANNVSSDFKLEIQALAALGKDKELGPLNLSLRVSNRVAELSGPVPSAELGRRAIELVEAIPGLRGVRNKQLYITRAPRSEQRLALPLEDGKPTQTRSASPGILSARDPAPWSPESPRVSQRSSDPEPHTATLLAPEAVASPARAPEPGRLTANPRPFPKPPSIDVSLDRLRQSDRRFRAIRTEVQGATVRIYTGDTSGEHIMAFARAVTHLPGVERVVVKDTSAGPR
jgi:osmotically-inducible protein OsmY